MVMNGPTPIMSIMFSAVALPRPMPRIRGESLLVVGRWSLADVIAGGLIDFQEEAKQINKRKDRKGRPKAHSREPKAKDQRPRTKDQGPRTNDALLFSNVPHSTNSHTTGSPPALRPAIDGRTRTPRRYMF